MKPALSMGGVFFTLAAALGGATAGTEEKKPGRDSGVADPFSSATVLRLSLELPRDALEALRNDHRAYVRATLREADEVYTDVGVRLKGSAGSFRPVDSDKPGFTVKVNQFVPERRFRGLRKFLLNNAAQDPSYLSELLGNELFRGAGVPAPRAGFASVEVNGRDLGLYVFIEAVSRDFLSQHFGNPQGSLYEGPGDVTGEIDADSRGLFLDRADLCMLSNAAQEGNPSERMRRLREVLDMDRFVTFLAMEAILWHWDGYSVGVNNFRIYNDPSTGRMVFLPHGSDQLFQDPQGPLVPEIQGLVARAVLTAPEGQQIYRKRLRTLLAAVFDPGVVRRRVMSLAAVVRPVLARRSEEEANDHQSAVAQLLERITQRLQNAEEQVSAEGGLFGMPLQFDGDGMARVSGWKPRGDRGDPELAHEEGEVLRDGPDVRRILRISSRPDEDECVASWRTKVILPAGKYRFAGLVRTQGVRPLEGEEGEGAYPSGAGLRISGHHTGRKVLGDSDWRPFEFDFTVGPEGAKGDGEDGEDREDREDCGGGTNAGECETGDAALPSESIVQLVCELRASGGQAWFDAGSLRLIRRH